MVEKQIGEMVTLYKGEFMQNVKVELTSFKRGKNQEQHSFIYSVKHNNGKTTVEQPLTISSVDKLINPKWVASISIDDFPPQDSPQEAAMKLATWLERLAISIKNGKYQPFENVEFKKINCINKELHNEN
jgi:hypothetical protein